MNILVAYDSYFGNTEKVAYKIAEVLGKDTSIHRVQDVSMDLLKDLDLFVLGSPTRGFRPSEATKAFLGKLDRNALEGVKVAAFDTRMNPEKVGNPILGFMVKIFGYAAKPIADKLVKRGGVLLGEPIGFEVVESEGPLYEGELERAETWARGLLS